MGQSLKSIFRICIFFSLFIFLGCATKPNDQYSFQKWVPETHRQQEILTTIIRYIYVPSQGVAKANRFDEQYDQIYLEQSSKFEMVSYFVDETTGWHYYFLIRPARNIHNHKRGVLGKFRISEDSTIYDFEEICVTPMMSVEDILAKGEFLWKDLIYFKQLERYINNPSYIEFPSERSIYNKEKYEWVYNMEIEG